MIQDSSQNRLYHIVFVEPPQEERAEIIVSYHNMFWENLGLFFIFFICFVGFVTICLFLTTLLKDI